MSESTSISWDVFGLQAAKLISTKSKDPSTQTGAVILDEKHRPVSFGYNGFPRGINDDTRLHDRELKNSFVIHAELNAVLFSGERDLSGCTIYVWPWPPCSRCAAVIIQMGIKRVVAPYPPKEWWTPARAEWQRSFEIASWLFAEAGVQWVHEVPDL